MILLVGTMGGFEIIALSGLIGGITGYFLRNKLKGKGAMTSIIVGVVGGVAINIFLVTFFYQSYFLIPVYSVFGSWLFNFLLNKIQRSNNDDIEEK